MKLSITIPCYNEGENISLILERFSQVIKRNDIEVLLVNNGSKDNSEEVLAKLVPTYSFARFVTIKENQGYGYGIIYGLKNANAEYIGWTHADMQTDPADCIKALEIIEDYPETKREMVYVKGERNGRPLFDEFFTVGMSIFESLFLRKKLWDINAQPNVFHSSFFASWIDPPHDFSLDLYALYSGIKNGLTLHRFPVIFPERIHGESKWNTSFSAKFKFITRTIKYSKTLKKRLITNQSL